MPTRPAARALADADREPADIADLGGEAVLLAGGGRAILLQLAHPAVGRGVARHSDFVSRPLDRLHGTMAYVYAIASGDQRLIEKVVHRVNAVHSSVRSADGESPRYDATDPTLQLWVAATLYDTATLMHELVFGSLDDQTAEALYRQYAALGTALQVPAEFWPADRAAFRRYWDETSATLRTDATTRAVARDLLIPPALPVGLRAAMPLVRLLTVGLLTPEQRALFGLVWNDSRQRRFDRVIRVTRVVYPKLPDAIRRWPMRYYLRRLAG
ncbi:oxygenase MpaB family protein [Diaminobutyricimonas sp. TR449]|uniref:oxygenase MpaB family protein n=1 Tax=Diaminobutyricimonas sp. TR449 TaxID=2708076 RepID=UPI00142254E0|nr:oxygenase MpaB family protein [Diaminobutyricimonas sp. TR449]